MFSKVHRGTQCTLAHAVWQRKGSCFQPAVLLCSPAQRKLFYPHSLEFLFCHTDITREMHWQMQSQRDQGKGGVMGGRQRHRKGLRAEEQHEWQQRELLELQPKWLICCSPLLSSVQRGKKSQFETRHNSVSLMRSIDRWGEGEWWWPQDRGDGNILKFVFYVSTKKKTDEPLMWKICIHSFSKFTSGSLWKLVVDNSRKKSNEVIVMAERKGRGLTNTPPSWDLNVKWFQMPFFLDRINFLTSAVKTGCSFILIERLIHFVRLHASDWFVLINVSRQQKSSLLKMLFYFIEPYFICDVLRKSNSAFLPRWNYVQLTINKL